MVLGVGQNKYNQDIGLRATVVVKEKGQFNWPFFKILLVGSDPTVNFIFQ